MRVEATQVGVSLAAALEKAKQLEASEKKSGAALQQAGGGAAA